MAGPTDPEESRLVQLARWISYHLGPLLNGFGTLLLGVGASWSFVGERNDWQDFVWPGALALAGLILYVTGAIHASKRQSDLQRRNAELEAAKDRAEHRLADFELRRSQGSALYQEIWRGQLALTFDELKLDTSERVSIYRHSGTRDDGSAGKFRLLVRYSPNPELAKVGRAAYPDSEGCLALAWQRGLVFRDGLPDSHSDLDGYLAAQEELGVPKSTARGLKMASRAYFGFRLDDPFPGGPPRAVILFESEKAEGALRSDELVLVLRNMETGLLTRFLEFTRSFEPDIGLSEEQGY